MSDYKPPKRATKHWRELIKKVWHIDPLLCPKCGSEMKVIAMIDELPQESLPTIAYD